MKRKLKRALLYLLAMAMMLAVAACGAKNPKETAESVAHENAETEQTFNDEKIDERKSDIKNGAGAEEEPDDRIDEIGPTRRTSLYEDGPTTVTHLDGTTSETEVQYRWMSGRTVPYLTEAVVPAEEWSLDHLVELYRSGEVWLRPDRYCASFVFSSDGAHYALVTDEDGVVEDYRIGWMEIDGKYVWNTSGTPVTHSLSAETLVYRYQRGEWDGSMVWSPEYLKSAWVTERGNLVFYDPNDSWWYDWTQILPAAGATPVDHGLVVGDYTLAIRGQYVSAYHRDGMLIGAYKTPENGRDSDWYRFLWSEECFEAYPDYDPVVFLNGDFYQIDLKHGGVRRVFHDWLAFWADEDLHRRASDDRRASLVILYLEGDDLRQFTLEGGDQLVAPDCSLLEARQHIPMFDQTMRGISERGDRIASSWADTDLLIPLEYNEDGSFTADNWTIPATILASQY